MAIAIIEARTNLQAAFQLGANFVIFKPISTEKAKSSFRAARALMKRERRRSVRLPVNIAAYFRFQNGEGEQVSISSLSEGGMAVRFFGAPGRRIGPIAFSFALPDTTTVIEARGTIEMCIRDSPQSRSQSHLPGHALRRQRPDQSRHSR